MGPMISRRWVKRGLRLSVVFLALWLLVSFLVAYRLTRRPHARFDEPPPTVSWGRFEPHRITNPRRSETRGLVPRAGEPDSPSVLLLHGNGGSRRNCLHQAEILARRGYSVLMVSLRAHGDSSGDFNDIGYSARHDVVSAVRFLERHRPGTPIVVFGSSMGSAAAAFASNELGRRVRGYILECPYRALKTAVWNRVENALPPLLDLLAYRGLLIAAPLVISDLEKISPLSAVSAVPHEVPILILAGGRDTRARLHEARAIHQRVKSHARLSIYEDADHVRLLDTDPERYEREILDFLRGIEVPFSEEPRM